MKKSRFTEEQIVFALKQAELGTSVPDVCCKLGISPSELKHMRQLEEENLRLKRLVADLSLDKAMLQDVLAKKSWRWYVCGNGSGICKSATVPVFVDHFSLRCGMLIPYFLLKILLKLMGLP